jgi:hypothetical protein
MCVYIYMYSILYLCMYLVSKTFIFVRHWNAGWVRAVQQVHAISCSPVVVRDGNVALVVLQLQ